MELMLNIFIMLGQMIKSILMVMYLVAFCNGERQIFLSSNISTVKIANNQSIQLTQSEALWTQSQYWCCWWWYWQYPQYSEYWKYIDLPLPNQIYDEGARILYIDQSKYPTLFTTNKTLRYELMFLPDISDEVQASIISQVGDYTAPQLIFNGLYLPLNKYYYDWFYLPYQKNIPKIKIQPGVMNNLTILINQVNDQYQTAIFAYIYKEWGAKDNQGTVIGQIAGPIAFLFIFFLLISWRLSRKPKQQSIIKDQSAVEAAHSQVLCLQREIVGQA